MKNILEKKIFTKCIDVRGNLISSYVFQNDKEVDKWLKNDYSILKEKHDNLSYNIRELDSLKIGDECYVLGEGDDIFTIKGIIKFSPNRYGFILDSGWTEEVAKCYKSL